MSKKISKNSRAARQSGAYDLEVKDLTNLPRVEKTDLTNILIRTAAKNGALLEAKISKKADKSKRGKKINKKALEDKLANSISSMDKDRLVKALNFTNRLDGKIAKSISRAKYVQNTRKAGWDSTNDTIRRELALLSGNLSVASKGTTKDDMDKESEENPEAFDSLAEDKVAQKTPVNRFGVLPDDVEE
ncbi:Ecm1p [Saccharomyces cerevisiae x Saccharomyces kudriavzevii VIN7]|uniref:Ecm1p n=1 Tax=Saccharomyces cerevisiae x Saccharomyces kudriavzevii (strain VIN7) TaxID=1095631 RepID=H0GQR4_SACCK|nr:Ecm1p [Saccharomyces cerevisiae x Saccharomyces kudriavzevii VIN7]